MSQKEFRKCVLASYGAGVSEIEELIAYNHIIFNQNCLTSTLEIPLTAEPHVIVWQKYINEAQIVGAFEVLKRVLVQFQFPIKAGISQTEAYRTAIRKGVIAEDTSKVTGLILRKPQKLQMLMHHGFAGPIPVLLAGCREDFISLVQALAMRNEPMLIPESMGACVVAGFNNWDRIHQYRKQWEKQNVGNCSEARWVREFSQLIPQKHLYQDKFIILSKGDYSYVSPEEIGLPELAWQQISLTIRLEHEYTHYFTRRLFSSMRNNLLDELIADYRGIVAAIGHYRADWFLRFMGLESFPAYREGGRLQNYRGQPSLSDGAFKILQVLVKNAAENLQHFDAGCGDELKTPYGQILILIALTSLTLEELASQEAVLLIQKAVDRLQAVVGK